MYELCIQCDLLEKKASPGVVNTLGEMSTDAISEVLSLVMRKIEYSTPRRNLHPYCRSCEYDTERIIGVGSQHRVALCGSSRKPLSWGIGVAWFSSSYSSIVNATKWFPKRRGSTFSHLIG